MSKKMNVGLLRQWLNEDRIDDPDKMVTNEMLEKWQADESKCEHGLNIDCCIKCYAKGLKMKKIEKLEFDKTDLYGINEIEDKINEIAQMLEDHINKDL